MNSPLRVAIAGLGTVGSKVVHLLRTHRLLHEQRGGRSIVLTAASAKSPKPELELDGSRWFDDASAMATDPSVDVVIELIGGHQGIARTVCESALGHGKHLITANKALLAYHGNELANLACEHGAVLAFEAAVGGGIPIIKSLREALAANRLTKVYGILNGTCNYILSQMRSSGRDLASVLEQAQELGYAEREPSIDVGGLDTAHKLAILAAVAFDCPISFPLEHVKGIGSVTPDDILFAEELGYRIKLLGIACRHELAEGRDTLELRVHPCLVPAGSPTASIEGVSNTVVVEGDFIEQLLLVGPGAGAGPTASAVVADLLDLARGHRVASLSPQAKPMETLPIAHRIGAYYLRLMVRDEVGVLALIAHALGAQNISIEQFIQRRRWPGQLVPVVLTTHQTNEAAMQRGLVAVQQLDAVCDHCLIRLEQF